MASNYRNSAGTDLDNLFRVTNSNAGAIGFIESGGQDLGNRYPTGSLGYNVGYKNSAGTDIGYLRSNDFATDVNLRITWERIFDENGMAIIGGYYIGSGNIFGYSFTIKQEWSDDSSYDYYSLAINGIVGSTAIITRLNTGSSVTLTYNNKKKHFGLSSKTSLFGDIVYPTMVPLRIKINF